VQTFLPYEDFVATAAVLDDRRLGRQRVETYQILRALTWTSYGWKNHPAVKMWREFVPALVRYGLDVCDDCGLVVLNRVSGIADLGLPVLALG
jgi:hypothetical protein